jgi:chromosome segregation protein
LNSIEQYEQVNERYEFLVSQRDDLLSAKNQLFDTMAEMDNEVKTRFKEVFEAIRKEFKVVFPNMFGGGRAELVLTDPTDLLKTGIEIEAQPPGKKLQNLKFAFWWRTRADSHRTSIFNHPSPSSTILYSWTK